MRTLSSVSLAAVCLAAAGALAQSPDAPDAGNANSDIMQNNAPANNTPSKATDENAAAPQSISQTCTKQAEDKNLSGNEKTIFITKCRHGKTTRSDN